MYYLVETLSLQNLFEHRDHTYMNLTLEFLSLLIYYTVPNSASTVGTVKFRMFNIKYTYITDQIAELLSFPYRKDVPCEAPL